MESPNAAKVIQCAIGLEQAQDRVFDCFAQARSFGTDYAECLLNCIAETEAVQVVATVHYESDGKWLARYRLHYDISKEPAAAAEFHLSTADISDADKGEIAAIIAVRGVLDYTASDPEDNHTDFCTPFMIALCNNDAFRNPVPDIRLTTAALSDDWLHPAKYEGAVRLYFSDDDVCRLECLILSEHNVITEIVNKVYLEEIRVYSSSFTEVETRLGVLTPEQCCTRAAQLLAQYASQYSDPEVDVEE